MTTYDSFLLFQTPDTSLTAMSPEPKSRRRISRKADDSVGCSLDESDKSDENDNPEDVNDQVK